MKKPFRYALCALLTLLLLALAGAGVYLFEFSLHPSRNEGRNTVGSYAYLFDTYPQTIGWIDSLQSEGALRDTFLVSRQGGRLHALYVPAAVPTSHTAVIVHGYTDCSVRMLMIGYLYHRHLGYNILLPDLHAHGQSEGTYIRMGWLDRLDLLGWMQLANERFGGQTRQVLHGISMGASAVMMLSGEQLPPYVACIIEDCGYTDVFDQFAYIMKRDFGLPAFPLLYTANVVSRLADDWGVWFTGASAVQQVAKCKLPMLFIHGDADTYVPTRMAYTLYEAKPLPKELWIVPEATHAMSYKMRPGEYTRRVREFVERYVGE
ncbi:MAG: alpha/beta hydrolase [Prevotellaceae bacterium]|jgi:fermentation-respiration switch protein FrsA (DUF1100 family)|nr:alpha/beta hydrolase [Prevotellaceae bacterium]